MNRNTTLFFINNKFAWYDENAIEILGIDTVNKVGCTIDEFFNKETVGHISRFAQKETECKLGFPSGIIMDGTVSKTTFCGRDLCAVKLSSPNNLYPFKNDVKPAFQNVVTDSLEKIQNRLNSLETSKNNKKILDLKNEIFLMIKKLNTLFNEAFKNGYKNPLEGFMLIDLWQLIKSCEKDINSIGNVNLGGIPCESHHVYTSSTNFRLLMLGILNSFSNKGERAYVSFHKDNLKFMRIANFTENSGSYKRIDYFSADEIEKQLNFQELAALSNVALNKNTFENGLTEYILIFDAKNYEQIKEV